MFLDEANRTIRLIGSPTGATTNGLIDKDGVSLQALYSALIDLWLTPDYQDSPFPMCAVDAMSGQYKFGTDGQYYSGWKPYDDTTRNMLRDGGWEEYSSTSPLPANTATGILTRIYVGIFALGTINAGAQPYYQLAANGNPINFPFTGSPNIGVQVYGDANNGNFNLRSYFKAYVREQGYKYKDSSLSDTGRTTTSAVTVNVLLTNEPDTRITAADSLMNTAPYDGITITYYNTNQNKLIGTSTYPYRVVIEGNGASLEQIYTKVQYLLRQSTDIDSGTGTVVGKIADQLLTFYGDTLYTSTGVFVNNMYNADLNRIILTDYNGIQRQYPYVATGFIQFNSNITNDTSAVYAMFFTTNPGGNYGSNNAIIVQDINGIPMTGSVAGNSKISFTFHYDGNVQGGRTPSTDAAVTVVAMGLKTGEYTTATGTIGRTTGQTIGVVAGLERVYSNA